MKNKTFYRDVARAVAGNSFDVIRPSDNVPDFSERHKWTEPIITASMAIGLGIYLTGYLCWKQIL